MAEPSNEQYTVVELFPKAQTSCLQKLTARINNDTWQLFSLKSVERNGDNTIYESTDYKINVDAKVAITDPTQGIPHGWQLIEKP